MIKIPCSKLEQVRQDPIAYVQQILSENKGGGSHGMFSCFQDTTRLFHLGEVGMNEGVKTLQQKFMRFVDNVENRGKQELLLKQFVNYCEEYLKKEFCFVDGCRNIKWNIIEEVTLTGRTPLVVKNHNGLFSYILTERAFNWQTELRFPLIQSYISTETVRCGSDELNIGVYNVSTSKFDFRNFQTIELTNVINETSNIFKNVHKEYLKRKK